MIRARAAVWIGPLAVVAAAACAHTISQVDRLCTPGNFVFCRCKDLSEGTKQCSDDGQSFGPCNACQPGNEEMPESDFDASIPVVDSSRPDRVVVQPDVADAPSLGKPAPGDVLVTEIMYDPSGAEPNEEWFEVYNRTATPMLLDGLTVKDGGNRTVAISGGVVIAPKAYALFVRSASAATAAGIASASIAFEYGAFAPVNGGVILSNSAGGAVWIVDETTVIAGGQYGGWFSQPAPGGQSIQLNVLTLDASGQKASWCLSSNQWAPGSDLGTPGAAADCP